MPFSKINRNFNSAECGERNKVKHGSRCLHEKCAIAFGYTQALPIDDLGVAKTKTKLKLDSKFSKY